MATLPTTHTVAVGDKITAADANTYVRDAVSFFSSVPRLHVYASGAQTLSNSTITVLTFDSELNAAGSSSGGTSIYQSFFGGLAVSNNNSTATFDISLTAGDYLEVFASQNSGGNLNTVGGAYATFAQMRWTATS